MVVGVLALGIFVSAHDVRDFRVRQDSNRVVENTSPPPVSASPIGPPTRPPIGYPSFGLSGATGSAAPPAVINPYAGESR
jgi:hypothetical protein